MQLQVAQISHQLEALCLDLVASEALQDPSSERSEYVLYPVAWRWVAVATARQSRS